MKEKITPRSECTSFNLGCTFAVLLLRLWLGLRALQTGVEKYSGTRSADQLIKVDGSANTYGLTEATSSKVYGLDMYHGVPQALYTKFAQEPLISSFGLKLFSLALGPALIITGVMLLLGVFSRVSLFLMGLIYVSLTYGLILINESSGIAWLGIHMIMITMMLYLADHNRLEITRRWKL